MARPAPTRNGRTPNGSRSANGWPARASKFSCRGETSASRRVAVTWRRRFPGARILDSPIDRRSRQDGRRGLRCGRRRHRATSACGSVRSAAGRDFPVNAALPHRPDRQRPDSDVWRERSFNHGQAGDRGIRATTRIPATVSADACRRPQMEARPAAITQR